jgi:hypothetical protein
MAIINTTNIGSTPIQLFQDYNDSGWTVNGGIATHTQCNTGQIINNGLTLVLGQVYQVQYTVLNWSFGFVQAKLGTNGGGIYTANGTYTDTITANGTQLSFNSNGSLSIQLVSVVIINAVSNFNTVSFNERNNRWETFWSYDPEMMVNYNQKLFTFKNGNLWAHETNGLYNNFYGNQFPSLIQMSANGKDLGTENKLFFTVKVDSTGVWYFPNIQTPVSDNYPKGQLSSLGPQNMNLKEGIFWADLLKDINDPNFTNALDAILKGRPMRGKCLICTLQTDSVFLTKLRNTYIYYSISERNS